MRLNRLSIVAASWLAVCVMAPVASADNLVAPRAASTVVPKAPQLEHLAEQEAMKNLWKQLNADEKAAALDQAKKQLEANPPKRPKLTGNKEEDAIRGALKRIRQLPSDKRDGARRELRTCIDQIVPPPGTPASQKSLTPPPAIVQPVPSVNKPITIRRSGGCHLRQAVAGCR